MTDAATMPDAAPHVNLRLEQQALGQILRFPEAWDLYAGAGLQEADFFRLAHRLEWRACAAVAAAGATPDLVTVGVELRAQSSLEEVGPAYHAWLVDDVEFARPTPETAHFVAGELRRLATMRQLAAAIENGDLATAGELVDMARARPTGVRRVYDAAGQIEAIRQDVARDQLGLLWLGFPTLDNMLEGLRAGEVLGWMARPGVGKTLVFCSVTQCVAETELGHVFFSLEMPAAQIVTRVMGQYFGLSRRVLRERFEANALDLAEYMETFRRWVVVDTPGLDVPGMAAELRRIQAEELRGTPIRVVTVDHLGLIGGDRRMSAYDRVSLHARELKDFAKEFNVTVLLAVQVNRDAGGGDGSKELHMGSARDSGVVEEALDYLIGMRRLDRSQTLPAAERDAYRDILFAKLLKNRHGAPDTEIAIRIDPGTLRLREDPHVAIAQDDLALIAASAGSRRR